DGREPAVRYRELRSHVVVVVQEILSVVAHGALAGGVGELARARFGSDAALGVALGSVDESIHIDGAGGGEVPAADVAVTLQPGRAHVVVAGGARLVEVVLRA